MIIIILYLWVSCRKLSSPKPFSPVEGSAMRSKSPDHSAGSSSTHSSGSSSTSSHSPSPVPVQKDKKDKPTKPKRSNKVEPEYLMNQLIVKSFVMIHSSLLLTVHASRSRSFCLITVKQYPYLKLIRLHFLQSVLYCLE